MTKMPQRPRARDDRELTWFRRREFLQAAAAFTAWGGFATAHAQQRGNVVELVGDARLNGQPLRPDGVVQTGDVIQTGPGSHLIFVIGTSAFHVRQNSTLVVERGLALNIVGGLRLLSGAVASVWSRGPLRQVVTPTLTAGIRGTGLYVELMPDQDTYFCNCYGEIELVGLGGPRQLTKTTYHESYWAETHEEDGAWLHPADAINHTDEEMEFLARLVGQRTGWQVTGVKPVKTGKSGKSAY